MTAAKIPFEIVPGVSAIVASPAYAGFPSAAKKPLFRQRVVVTRARGQSTKMTRELEECGAQVLEVPTIKIVPPTDPQQLTDALMELNSYDWIVFTSVNGVSGFFELFVTAFDDMRDIGGVKIAAVGPSTAARLQELHLKVDLMPPEFVAKKIVETLAAYESIENLKMLLVRAEVGGHDGVLNLVGHDPTIPVLAG